MKFRATEYLRFWNPPREDSVQGKLRARFEGRSRQEAIAANQGMYRAVERADSLSDWSNLKKLKGAKSYFRRKLGDYRIGFALENDTLIFVRFLDRKDIYKYFP